MRQCRTIRMLAEKIIEFIRSDLREAACFEITVRSKNRTIDLNRYSVSR